MTQVICVNISCLGDDAYRSLYEQASAIRKQKAGRYRRCEDSLRCVTADALLRFALGTSQYTEIQPAGGKPFLSDRPDFHYNLSHSGNWVVIAFGSHEVGVDVEHIRADIDIDAIISRFFSPQEQQYVREAPVQSCCRFFEIWTRKESYMKYLGTGMKTEMTSFNTLGLGPGVQFHQRSLPGGYCLSLCTANNDYLFQLLDAQRLLIKGEIK